MKVTIKNPSPETIERLGVIPNWVLSCDKQTFNQSVRQMKDLYDFPVCEITDAKIMMNGDLVITDEPLLRPLATYESQCFIIYQYAQALIGFVNKIGSREIKLMRMD